jgi:hypothetical protein
MSQVFMKIIGRNRSLLPKGHINQTDVVGTLALNGYNFIKDGTENKVSNKAKTYDNPFCQRAILKP